MANPGVEDVGGVGRPKGRRGEDPKGVARDERDCSSTNLELHETLGRGRPTAVTAHRAACEDAAGVAEVGAELQRCRACVADGLSASHLGASKGADVIKISHVDRSARARPGVRLLNRIIRRRERGDGGGWAIS